MNNAVPLLTFAAAAISFAVTIAVLLITLSFRKATMKTLADILALEAGEATALGLVAQAVQTLLTNDATLKAQLADILAGNLPTAVQQQVDDAFAASSKNIDSVNAILASLVPPAPTAASAGAPAASSDSGAAAGGGDNSTGTAGT